MAAHGHWGAWASAALIPAIQRLPAEAGWAFDTLDAIVFGRGPAPSPAAHGCAVRRPGVCARNGKGTPVVPVDHLLAIGRGRRQQTAAPRLLAVLDARMNRSSGAHCTWQEATRQWSTDADFGLCAPKR